MGIEENGNPRHTFREFTTEELELEIAARREMTEAVETELWHQYRSCGAEVYDRVYCIAGYKTLFRIKRDCDAHLMADAIAMCKGRITNFLIYKTLYPIQIVEPDKCNEMPICTIPEILLRETRDKLIALRMQPDVVNKALDQYVQFANLQPLSELCRISGLSKPEWLK